MATHLISATLRAPGRDYRELRKAITSLGAGGWWHQMNDVWLVNSRLDAVRIRDFLVQFIDINDQLFVVNVGKDWATQNLPSDASQWLAGHLPVYAAA